MVDIINHKKYYVTIITLLITLVILKYSEFDNKLENMDLSSAAPSRPFSGKKTLAWILHFNYKPNPDAVSTLLRFYAQHFSMIVIVSPSGRPSDFQEEREEVRDKVIWSPKCNNSENGHTADTMMRCYANGLDILRSQATFQKTDYVVLSNDDVILNMTKVQEFARGGLPVSHIHPSLDAPRMFSPPTPGLKYFQDWGYARWWPPCQEHFAQVPEEYKRRFEQRFGDVALSGGVDVFFLPPASVAEFIFLSSVVSDCWIEMGIPNALGMLSVPVKFYIPPVFMYKWWGILITPPLFEAVIGNNSIVAFHPFKLSYPEHREALAGFMEKYKFNA